MNFKSKFILVVLLVSGLIGSTCFCMLSDKLFCAIKANNLEAVEACIKDGAIDVNALGYYKETPLHAACLNKDFTLIELLVKEGASINQQDVYGDTPLHVLLYDPVIFPDLDPNLVKLLLQSGVDVTVTNNEGKTVLHFACEYRNPEIAQLIINAGADVNAKDNSGQVPLNIACFNRNFEVIKLLFEAGAKIPVEDDKERLKY